MDGPVVGAIITASVAAAVAILGAVRGLYQSALDRRYEWRRQCLVDAQTAMLTLREALLVYGEALGPPLPAAPVAPAVPAAPPAGAAADPAGTPPVVLAPPGAPPPGAAQSYVMGVPEPVEVRVAVARGRFAVARSRLDDPVLDDAYGVWDARARESFISAQELPRSAEEEAFAEVNRLTGAALRSLRATVPGRVRRRSGGQ